MRRGLSKSARCDRRTRASLSRGLTWQHQADAGRIRGRLQRAVRALLVSGSSARAGCSALWASAVLHDGSLRVNAARSIRPSRCPFYTSPRQPLLTHTPKASSPASPPLLR